MDVEGSNSIAIYRGQETIGVYSLCKGGICITHQLSGESPRYIHMNLKEAQWVFKELALILPKPKE